MNQWRLPDPPEMITGLLRSPVGALFARPWFDKAALGVLSRWFFPLSRLWGTARLANGSVETYCEALELDASAGLRGRIEQRLIKFEQIRHDVAGYEKRWNEAFFGADDVPLDIRGQIEHDRLHARHDYNSFRRNFVPLGIADIIQPINWDIPSPATANDVYGSKNVNPAEAFAAPRQMPEIEQSKPVRGIVGMDYWLRFNSPSDRMNDKVYARVYEPEGVIDPPTIIFGHGICVEFDHWRGMVDEVEAMVGLGIRVIRPEAPWHGRRVLPGSYGGERFIATAPMGALDHFTAAAREWSVLIDWARKLSSAPIAIGGSSLGAMTAQIVASNAKFWPSHLHPDALFLITHCGRIEDAVADGTLAKVWGIEEATRQHGWTPELVEDYAPLLNALGPTVMPPENVVTVLGKYDDVTPFNSGKALIDSWKVPEENTFIWPRGHFSVPLGMMRDHAPLRQLKSVLDRLGK